MLKNQQNTSFVQPPSAPIILLSSAFLFVGLLLTVALLSYNVADPAWRHNTGTDISNSLGFLGAWYSDLSFSLIGKLSYLPPLALLAFFIHAWREKSIDKELFSWRLFMLFTAILSGCVLWTKHDANVINSVALTGGGAVGAWLVIGLEKSVQSVPIIMAFSSLIFAISISLLFNIPWGRIADWIGASLTTLFSNLLFFRGRQPTSQGSDSSVDVGHTAPYTQESTTATPQTQIKQQATPSTVAEQAQPTDTASDSRLRSSMISVTELLRGKTQTLGQKVQVFKQAVQDKSTTVEQQPQRRAPTFTIDRGEESAPAYVEQTPTQNHTQPVHSRPPRSQVHEEPLQLGSSEAGSEHFAFSEAAPSTTPVTPQVESAYDLGLDKQPVHSAKKTTESHFFDFSPEQSANLAQATLMDEQQLAKQTQAQYSSQQSTEQEQITQAYEQQSQQLTEQSSDSMDNFISTLTRTAKKQHHATPQADIASDAAPLTADTHDLESSIETLSRDIPEARPQRPESVPEPTITPSVPVQRMPEIKVEATKPKTDSLIQSQAAPLQPVSEMESQPVPELETQSTPQPAVEPITQVQPSPQQQTEDTVSPTDRGNDDWDDSLYDDLVAQTVIPPQVGAEVSEPIVDDSTLPASTKTTATIGKAYDNSETQVPIKKIEEERDYALPSVQLLDSPPPQKNAYTEDVLAEMAGVLESTLQQFNIQATVMYVSPGPVITRFELDLAPGIQAKKITNLSVDLARALAVSRVRVEEVIPGSSYVGLEVPNKQRQIVYFKDLVCSKAFRDSQSPLTISLGSDTSGRPQVVDLMKMPHALVAGTTGSGKSVCINVMLLSMLYKASPKDLRLILVDPKMLEMSMYEDIPHLLTPVITDMNEAENALTWAVGEMERRYQLMAALKVRKIDAFNAAVEAAIAEGEPLKDPLWEPDEQVGYTHHPTLERLPFIVIVIDELADMMMVVGKQVEQLIARLTQKARAAGIHVVLATQRPSTDVLTGLIKANVPTRLAFQVSSGTDSRVIIDSVGAEKLLGHGDMLYVPPGASHPQRLHGAFVGDAETDRITDYLRSTGEPDYIAGITQKQAPETLGAFGAAEAADSKVELDPLYDDAVAVVLETGKASISSVQRHLRIGYNRAARMIEDMQTRGIVSEPVNGVRKVLGGTSQSTS